MIRFTLVIGMLAVAVLRAQEPEFVALFNGRDLDGWVNVNCAPETWSVRQGMIYCTGIPTGALRTTRQYENFVLELEWRHLKTGGNSGVFIWAGPIAAQGVPFLRAIEVQVLDNGYNSTGKGEWFTTHGDVFPIHGSTMKPFGRHRGMRSFPSAEQSRPSPEWNHYRIVCTNGVVRLHVNGREVSGGEECNYRKGYLALESEGAPIEFRNIRIQELPAGGAPVQVAPVDLGWRSLFTGTDLRGWQTNSATADRWVVLGERLALVADGSSTHATLWTREEFDNFELVIDCRATQAAKDQKVPLPAVKLRGMEDIAIELHLPEIAAEKHQRFTVTLKGNTGMVSRQDGTDRPFTLPAGAPKRGRVGLTATGAPLEFMNLYIRELE
jgi:hypothetical protein